MPAPTDSLWRRTTRTAAIRQSETTECGIASLAIVLAWHGIDTSLEDLRRQVGSTRFGSSARQLLELASQNGLRGSAFRRDLSALGTVSLPAIAHCRFIHFVVVEAVTSTHVVVNDPGLGPQRILLEDFAEDFTGIVLVFEPTSRDRRRPYDGWRHELGRWLGRHPFHCASILATAILSGAAAAATVGLLAIAGSPEQAIPAAGCAGIALVCELLCRLSATALAERLALDTDALVQQRFLDLPPAWFANRTPAQIADTLSLGQPWLKLLHMALTIVRAVLFLPLLILAPLIAPLAGTLVAAALLVSFAVVAVAAGRRGEQRGIEPSDLDLTVIPEPTVLANRESWSLGGRDEELWTRLAGTHAVIHSQVEDNKQWQARQRLGLQALHLAALAAALAQGLMDAAWGEAASLALLTMLSYRMLDGLGPQLPGLAALQGHLHRLADLQASSSIQNQSIAAPGRGNGSLRLQHADKVMMVKPGEALVIRGPSGSGKSRLARQIAGLETGPDCTITLDGCLTAHVSGRPGQIAHLDAAMSIFSGTVGDNLRLGESYADQVLMSALETVELSLAVADRGGLSLALTEERTALSGGQIRRLCIARALLRKPRLLVLDETLDALEGELAGRIIARLLAGGLIVVLVGEQGCAAIDAPHVIDLGPMET